MTTPTRTTPTRTTHSSAPRSTARSRRSTRALPRRALGAEAARRPARGGGPFRRPPLRAGRRAAGHRDRRSGRPAFRLVKAGATVSGYTTDLSWRPSPFTGVADVPRVLREFEARRHDRPPGRSTTPGSRSPATAASSRRSSGTRRRRTPTSRRGGRRGCPVHHDTHEVLSLQVAGEKRWLVYEPALELPLKNQRYRAALGAPGEPVLDVTLRAGDTLYLPRGWLHQALTSDSDSLHVTVGVNVRRWIDEARAAIDDRAYDLGVPPLGRRTTPPALPELDAGGGGAARPRAASCAPAARSSTASCRSCGRSHSLDVDTPLVRRDTVIADLRRDDCSSSRARSCGSPSGSRRSSSSSSRRRRRSRAARSPRTARRRRPAGAGQAPRARGVPAT